MNVAQCECADANEPAHFDGPRTIDRGAVAQLARSVRTPRDEYPIGSYGGGEIRTRLDRNRLQAADHSRLRFETRRAGAELTEGRASPGMDVAAAKQRERVRSPGRN